MRRGRLGHCHPHDGGSQLSPPQPGGPRVLPQRLLFAGCKQFPCFWRRARTKLCCTVSIGPVQGPSFSFKLRSCSPLLPLHRWLEVPGLCKGSWPPWSSGDAGTAALGGLPACAHACKGGFCSGGSPGAAGRVPAWQGDTGMAGGCRGVCGHGCACTCACVCMHVCSCICTGMCTHGHTCAYTCACVCVRVCVCTRACACTRCQPSAMRCEPSSPHGGLWHPAPALCGALPQSRPSQEFPDIFFSTFKNFHLLTSYHFFMEMNPS